LFSEEHKTFYLEQNFYHLIEIDCMSSWNFPIAIYFSFTLVWQIWHFLWQWQYHSWQLTGHLLLWLNLAKWAKKLFSHGSMKQKRFFVIKNLGK
jgi:hypothetical protein